jgi:cell division protease FtsH
LKNRNNLVLGSLIVLSLFLGYSYYNSSLSSSVNQETVSYSSLLEKAKAGSLKKVILNNNMVKAEARDSKVYLASIPLNDPDFIKTLKEANVEIIVSSPDTSSGFASWIFIGFVLLFLYFLFKSLRGGGQDNSSGSGSGGGAGGFGAFGFGKSKAKLINPKDSNITFADVAGIEEAKNEVQEIVEFLKNPKKFQKLGAKIPKGCLLVGPPGSGKTLLARAIAGEAKVAFFSISGSDFVEMFVGVGASRVRDLFVQAKKQAPCIIFIDEIDAVGRQRGVGIGGGNDEREQTLNQLLVEMDGFSANSGVIVVAATNRKDVLDPALLRPGRFDRQVYVSLPDVIGREKILGIYLAKLPLDNDVNVSVIARGTTGFSGADLSNLTNEAALLAASQNKDKISMKDFETSRDKILMGTERKSAKMTEKDRKLTAYHEAGHALVAFKVADYYPVHKVSIIPRGMALGVTSFLPEKDEYSRTYTQLISQLAVLFGGRIAEEIIFGKENITTGASSDIQMATNVARKMITEWGFSDEIGRLRYTENESNSFLGHSSNMKNVSEETAKKIEESMKKLITDAEASARKILLENKDAFEMLTQALLDYETISGLEAKLVCEGKSIDEIRADGLSTRPADLNTKEENKSSLPKID